MGGQHRRPGDPYDVGFGKPPKQTRFKKGRSGNPNGRPRRKPDLYTELRRVLGETVTVTNQGEPRQVTVQEALLLRLRDQALRGEIRASKLLQKVVDALPDGPTAYDHIEMQVGLFRNLALLGLLVEESEREKANQSPDPAEAHNVE